MPDEVGLIAGQFRVMRRLGAGGMGEVYLAEQIGLDRKVVLKLVHAHLFANRAGAAERFAREARVLAQVNHPNVVQLYAYGTAEDGRPYFAMEYVDGRSLADELGRGPLGEGRALAIAAAVADAMAEVHQVGIVHRDLKPANIMLTNRRGNRDFVKVLDFGIAKAADEGRNDKLTAPGSFFGTPSYVAPEQATGQTVTPATDVYALGAMLFEMLTGQPVFAGSTPFEVIRKHVEAPPLPPSVVAPSVSPAADAIVLRCLQKAPADRFASADLAAALRSAAAQSTALPESSGDVAWAAPRDAAGTDAIPGGLAGGTQALPDVGDAGAAGAGGPEPARAKRGEVGRAERQVGREKEEPAWSRTPARSSSFTGRLGIWISALMVLTVFGWLMFAGVKVVRRWQDLAQRVDHRAPAPARRPFPASDQQPPAHTGSPVASPPPSVRPSNPSHPVGGTAGLSLAAVDAMAGCLNSHSERAWESYYRYTSWVNPAKGPTGHEGIIYGLYAVSPVDDCAGGVALAAREGIAPSEASRFVAAIRRLSGLTTQADAYYTAEDWKDDRMAKGKTFHKPLMDGYREFAAADRALRALLDQDAYARDHAAFAPAGAPTHLSRALARLRDASRALAHLIDIPWRRMVTLDRGRLEETLKETSGAAEAFGAVAQTGGDPAMKVVEKTNEMLRAARQFRRRVGPHPGWSEGERRNLSNQLAQWMVVGSPSAFVMSYNELVGALNDSKLSPGREATLVHVELPDGR